MNARGKEESLDGCCRDCNFDCSGGYDGRNWPDKYLVAALEHFRAQNVDAVVHCGDMADRGVIAEMQFHADAWRKVFPDGCAADGRKVKKLFVNGNHDVDGGDYGVAVLSRKAPLSVVRVPLPGKEPRVLLLCEFADFWFGTAHLDFGAYQQQAVKIVRDVVAEKSAAKPVFITGDWNATPKSETLAAMKDFMTVISKEDCRTFHDFKNHPPEDEYCIDYIAVDSIHAAKFKVNEAHVTSDGVTSDHNPVVVSVGLER